MNVSTKNIKTLKIYKGNTILYLPDKLKRDLDIYYDDMTRSNMDLVIVLDGAEGSGKSFTSHVLGQYFSWKSQIPFGIDNIHFTVKDYINTSELNEKFSVNILDESREAIGKRRSLSKSNVQFTNWLSENRDKQQVHILILPAIHDLDSYISTWRMKFIMHHLLYHVPDKEAPSGYKLVRGYFKIYENSKNLQQVIFNKTKYGYYAYPKEFKYKRKIKFSNIFTKSEQIKYLEKKTEKRRLKYEEAIKVDRFKERFTKLTKELNEKHNMSFREMSRLTGYNHKQISSNIKETDWGTDEVTNNNTGTKPTQVDNIQSKFTK